MYEGIGIGFLITGTIVLCANALLSIMANRIANYEQLDRGE